MRMLAFLAPLAFAGAAALLLGAAPPPSRTIYRHAVLIDGTGAPARPDMAVVVQGERIASVLPDRRLRRHRLAGARVIHLGGRFLLPGLIDSHVHLATPPDRPRALAVLGRDRRIDKILGLNFLAFAREIWG
jgi:imidazolonepropionase-like amidohydrolase